MKAHAVPCSRKETRRKAAARNPGAVYLVLVGPDPPATALAARRVGLDPSSIAYVPLFATQPRPACRTGAAPVRPADSSVRNRSGV